MNIFIIAIFLKISNKIFKIFKNLRPGSKGRAPARSQSGQFSLLQLHPDVTILLDKPAASKL